MFTGREFDGGRSGLKYETPEVMSLPGSNTNSAFSGAKQQQVTGNIVAPSRHTMQAKSEADGKRVYDDGCPTPTALIP